MKTSYFLIALITLSFVFSCKKDENKKTQNAEFTLTSIAKDGKLSVFTEGGKTIKDVTVIQDFVKGGDAFFNFDKPIDNGERIEFVGADSVHFLTSSGAIFRRCAYKMQGTKIFFYETFAEMITPSDQYLENLYRNIVKYQPVYAAPYTVSGLGGEYAYRKVTFTTVGYISKTELKIYRFVFKMHRDYGENYVYTSLGFPTNQFDENFAKKLNKYETLAIQPYTFRYKRSK